MTRTDVNIKLDTTIKGLDGKPLEFQFGKENRDGTLGIAIATILNTHTGIEAKDAIRVFRIIDEYAKGGTKTIDIDKVEFLIENIGQVKAFAPIVKGQVLMILEDLKDELNKSTEKQ